MNDEYLNKTGLQYYHGRIKTVFAEKDEVPTKLSELTNDGDGTTGSKYATETYVDENGGKIDSIKVNGTAQTITDKAVDITVPTKTSDLTNDGADGNGAYQTADDVQSAIDAALADITSFEYEVVQTLPASGEKGTIYLVPNQGSGSNTYDEYVWIDGDPTGSYEKIGSTDIDLSNNWDQSNLTAITTAEIDTIVEG